jgi:hypothetical protein
VIIGEEEAKTGLSWIREGKLEDEDEEEELRDAKTKGLNVFFLIEVLAWDNEERLKPFMEEVDIVAMKTQITMLYSIRYDVFHDQLGYPYFNVTIGR